MLNKAGKLENRSHCTLAKIESIELDNVMLFVQILFNYLFEHNKKTSSHSLKDQIEVLLRPDNSVEIPR